jgi:hypothetical protein
MNLPFQIIECKVLEKEFSEQSRKSKKGGGKNEVGEEIV